jgi:hypothetical protein
MYSLLTNELVRSLSTGLWCNSASASGASDLISHQSIVSRIPFYERHVPLLADTQHIIVEQEFAVIDYIQDSCNFAVIYTVYLHGVLHH